MGLSPIFGMTIHSHKFRLIHKFTYHRKSNRISKMKFQSNVLECVGNTPIVKLNRITQDSIHEFYVKLEFLNPGSSIKDRIAIQMVDDAVAEGKLKPGGTIIECTSGNTGMGLAMVAAVRGFQSIFVMPDKVSSEKVKALRAFGAKVVVTPTAVEPEDPRSYYSVAKKLSEEIPNSFYSNQYQNLSNPKAHYRMTGPEIWEQVGSSIDYIFVASGTGGTISGTSKYLKEKNPKLKAVCVDPEGSIYYDYFKTGVIPKILTTYKVEGFGEDFMPGAIDFAYIDDVVQVSDRECFQTARALVVKEGLFVGGSCGGALAGAIKYSAQIKTPQKILVILPDSGSRYLSKFYDDDWMRENGFMQHDDQWGTIKDLMGNKRETLIKADIKATVKDVVALMKQHSISQLPVFKGDELLGLVSETDLLSAMMQNPNAVHQGIDTWVHKNITVLDSSDPVSKLYPSLKKGMVAIVREGTNYIGILTKIDLIDYLARVAR